MRYKNLTKDQIHISLDRLTRFKNTKEKYLRVFTDILISNLIEPKYKKNDLYNLDAIELKELVEQIFNSSFPILKENNYRINNKLKKYENSIFNNDIYTNTLLDNKLDYVNALEYIKPDNPVNVKWLQSLSLDIDIKTLRETHYLKYPIEKVLLVEGITEEILLPAFSKYLGYDFYKHGIQVIPAGGKNQVVKMYYQLSDELKLPIFLLLDKDAEDNIQQIKPKLRNIDKIHLVGCGEFEDLLPRSLIIKTINNHFKNLASITQEDFVDTLPEVKNLENIYKNKGPHEFKKAEFAKLIRDNIAVNTDISYEIKEIIKEISNYQIKTLDTEICS